MTLIIGTDEAGYGPNLGPLVVAATAWRIPAGTAGAAAAELLAQALDEARAAAGIAGPLWADSKQIYKPGDGLAVLERGVLAALEASGRDPEPNASGPPTRITDATVLLDRLGATEPAATPPEWPAMLATPLPGAAAAAGIATTAAAVSAALARHHIQLLAVRCRVVHPAEFNRLLDAGLNKSDILSRTTLDLAATLWNAGREAAAEVWCDRHGGRKSYAGLVGRHFGAALVQTIGETPTLSAYLLPADRCRVEFAVGGEARLPVALASMTAKYIRELSVAAFNSHWSALQTNLRPTAGYPLDARRWREEADAAVRRAGIDEATLWRRA